MQTTPLLTPRSLFSHNTTTASSHTCPLEITTGPPIIPFISHYTFHTFASYLSGSCAAFSTALIFVLIIAHATHYTNPNQQRQIIRIALLIPWVGLWSWLVVWRDDVGDYLVGSLDFGCAVALGAFLVLMVGFVVAEEGGYGELFGHEEGFGGKRRGTAQLKGIWYSILQFIPTSLLIWLSTIAALTTHKYCKISLNIHFAHVWITALKLIVTTLAILASLYFHRVHKEKLSRHRILLKLFTFKSIIGLNVAQTFIISILTGHAILTPSKYLTYHDVNTGLASLLLACEMPIFALLMIFAFPAAPYKPGSTHARVEEEAYPTPAAGPFVAMGQALDLRDLVAGFVRGPMRLVRDQARGGEGMGGGAKVGLMEMQGTAYQGAGVPEEERLVRGNGDYGHSARIGNAV